MSADSHLSQPKPEKESSPVKQHHRLARGQKIDGQRDANKGAPKGSPTPRQTY